MPMETPMESYHLHVGQCHWYWKLFVCARQMTFFPKLWKWIKKIPAAAAVVGRRTWEHIHTIITLPLQNKNTSNTCIITLTQRGTFPVRDVWVTTYLLGYDTDVVLFIFNDYGFLAVDLPLVLFQARDCMCLWTAANRHGNPTPCERSSPQLLCFTLSQNTIIHFIKHSNVRLI